MGIKESFQSLWTSETADERALRRRIALARRGPTPSDKYLPIWVIGSMSIAVAVLLLLMALVCSQQRCRAGSPTEPTAAEKAASAVQAAAAAAQAAASR